MQCLVYGIERCPLLRGDYYTQILEVAFGTLLIVHYKEAVHHSGVSVKRGSTISHMIFSQGCPLRGVPLYLT